MSEIILSLKVASPQRIDVKALLPSKIALGSSKTLSEIKLPVGNRERTVGELFEIEGSTEGCERVVFRGRTECLDFLGQGLESGHIEVEGSAGSYLGMQMKGGSIRVSGSLDAYGAAELRGGWIEVLGDAGDFLGAALPGNLRGMRGGLVLIRGNAGDRVGDHLRRGIILIEGSAGAYLGSRMTAGTILVQGAVGPYAGYAMGRGTLLLLEGPEEMLPSFRDCGTHTLGFIPLLLKSLKGYRTVFSDLSPKFSRVRRYAGDFSSVGKGEILVAI